MKLYQIILIFSLSFTLVTLSYFSHRPKIITKEVVEKVEERVYDFTQEPEQMERYANIMNMVLMDRDEFEKREIEFQRKLQRQQISIWEEAYKEGFRKAKQNNE